MTLASIYRKASTHSAFMAVACLAAAVLITGCATTGGGSVNPFVGTWNLVVESALGTTEQTLVVGSDMTGAIDIDGASVEITNVATDGNNATFDVVFDIQGQELDAKFEGTIDGDSISGEYVTELGNGTVTGSRAQ